MAGNPFFSGRIPKELNEQIVKHCKETGKTKTDVLIAALSNYLNIPLIETDNKTDNQIGKEIANLQERMQRLEETIYQTPVITSDNNNDKGMIITVIPQSNDSIIAADNNCDNSSKSGKNSHKQINIKPESVKDNDNSSNHVKPDFANLETKDVVKKTGIGNSQMGRLKDKAFSEAKQQGYNIQPDIKFSSPIEVVQSRKEITIEDKKYKLFCIGIDSKRKPIWVLKPDDNASYQPDILK